MSAHLWLVFILASLPIHGAPGPNNLLALRHGMTCGLGPAALAMLARLPGYALIFLAAGLGLGAVIIAFPEAFRVLTIAGALYIVWLGLRAVRAHESAGAAAQDGTGGRSAARAEFLTAIANPKAILFATAFYAQFIDPAMPGYAAHYATMAAVSLSLESCLGGLYCVAGALARTHFRGDIILWLTRGSGAVLCLMGAGLLVEMVMSG
ncbi:LysE family translocator [Hoeflea sp.]|uniref:LysE family translocator n=1 Tax=Hoeflea sp. TaxID=1940281 RepID=UPI0019C9E946|nr:LysE family translocator [Hoeflea sp.]MBC7279919.1 LysE family translocator [Hoeflea sp.]